MDRSVDLALTGLAPPGDPWEACPMDRRDSEGLMDGGLGLRTLAQSGRRLVRSGTRISCASAALLLLLQACGGRASEDGGRRGGDGDGDAIEVGSGGAGEATGGAFGGDGAGGAHTGGAGEATGGAHTGGTGEATGGDGSGGDGTGGDGSGGDGSGGQPPLPLPEGCEPEMPSADEDSCALSVVCGPSSDYVSCTLLESGYWQCNCTPFHADRFYEIDGASGMDACTAASYLCVDDLELGDETCATRYGTSNPHWCDAELACGRSIGIDLPSGVEAWLVDYTSVQCEGADEESSFDCSCVRDGTTTNYYAISQADADVCGPLADFCKSGEQPVFGDEASCVETSNEYSSDSCLQTQTCTRTAELTDLVQLGESETFSSSCEELDDTTSRCRCWDDETNDSFLVESDAEPAACTTAFLNCAEDATIEVQGDAECALASLSSDAGYCNAELTCEQPVTVDGREAIAEGRLGFLCMQETPGEPWWCSCSSSEGTATFELGVESASTSEVCAAAPAACIEQLPAFIGSSSSIPDPENPLPLAE